MVQCMTTRCLVAIWFINLIWKKPSIGLNDLSFLKSFKGSASQRNGFFLSLVAWCHQASLFFSKEWRGNVSSLPRGVRQGDPLSPFLFIIFVEVLSRSISRSFYRGKVAFYYTPRSCDPNRCLLYTDDTMLFLNGSASSIRGILQVLDEYCKASGQKINPEKNNFLLDKNASCERIDIVRREIGFKHKFMPITYPGASLFQGRAKRSYFEGIFQ